MKPLPPHPSMDHLKRQSKELLSEALSGSTDAINRLETNLPGASKRSARSPASFKLHDAQSCIAREYGFVSWVALRSFVETARARAADPDQQVARFAHFAYAGDIAGGMDRSDPERAARYLALIVERGPLDGWIACASGDIDAVTQKLHRDPAWVNTPDGPLALPPLVAAAHSGLIHLPEYQQGIKEVVKLLLASGADPNQSVGSRWPPASPEHPSTEHRLTAVYGAAGVNHDAELTRILLEAGANPDDGETLYHSLEARDTDILSLLLEADVQIEGTNALYHALDFDNYPMFEMLLSSVTSIEEPKMGPLLHWAVKRRRSVAHIEAILAAGSDPNSVDEDGTSALMLAMQHGLPQIAAALRKAGAAEALSPEDEFVAACASANEAEARRLKKEDPRLPMSLGPVRLQMLPVLAEAGQGDAVRLMVKLGWPIQTRGGDWTASALNQAVFNGDAELAEFLLSNGAHWTEEHGYGDNACGTLSWASINRPTPAGDWVACARALLTHGMPAAQRDPENPDCVLLNGERRRFSDEVTAYLLSVDPPM